MLGEEMKDGIAMSSKRFDLSVGLMLQRRNIRRETHLFRPASVRFPVRFCHRQSTSRIYG
jgi:hypothetical protein